MQKLTMEMCKTNSLRLKKNGEFARFFYLPEAVRSSRDIVGRGLWNCLQLGAGNALPLAGSFVLFLAFFCLARNAG